ncbi:Elongin-C [Pseudolycoriella hygida]|uniref:Elongin-C n=1 Tax=Pseudolycoriella hygida TaxID=35572 RepID=A0A9Q0S6M2_9DIPT|nr:Elongin-C [Pseudolycoriella hygida]
MDQQTTSHNLIEGCKGPNSFYVKLVSSDGYQYIVKREHALISETIRDMLCERQIAENEINEIRFENISSHILAVVCSYLEYKYRFKGCRLNEVPEFQIPPAIVLGLTLASAFLKC